jgi:AraC family L-rhamnose operon regulatory protein RhaS
VGNPEIGMGKFYWVIIDLGIRRPHQEWKWPEWVMLTRNDLKRLTKILRQNDQWLWKCNSRIRSCFQQIGKTVDSDVNGSSASKIRLLVNELLICLLELLDDKKVELNESLTDSSRSVQLFINELDKNLNEAWTIERMADSAGVGLTRFTYHCRQLTNATPMRYLAMKRLERAKSFLRNNPELSVTEIAYSCGFATSQYFSTVFKRQEKCTPLEYRNRAIQEPVEQLQ